MINIPNDVQRIIVQQLGIEDLAALRCVTKTNVFESASAPILENRPPKKITKIFTMVTSLTHDAALGILVVGGNLKTWEKGHLQDVRTGRRTLLNVDAPLNDAFVHPSGKCIVGTLHSDKIVALDLKGNQIKLIEADYKIKRLLFCNAKKAYVEFYKKTEGCNGKKYYSLKLGDQFSPVHTQCCTVNKIKNLFFVDSKRKLIIEGGKIELSVMGFRVEDTLKTSVRVKFSTYSHARGYLLYPNEKEEIEVYGLAGKKFSLSPNESLCGRIVYDEKSGHLVLTTSFYQPQDPNYWPRGHIYISVRDFDKNIELKRFSTCGHLPELVIYAPEINCIITGGREVKESTKSCHVWNLNSLKCEYKFPLDNVGEIEQLSYNPESSEIYVTEDVGDEYKFTRIRFFKPLLG